MSKNFLNFFLSLKFVFSLCSLINQSLALNDTGSTEPPVPGVKASTIKISEIEPTIPKLIYKFILTTKSKEPEFIDVKVVPEDSRTHGPEPLILEASNISKLFESKKIISVKKNNLGSKFLPIEEPSIPGEIKLNNAITTKINEPGLPIIKKLSKSTMQRIEIKFPTINGISSFPSSPEPVIPTEKMIATILKTEPKIFTENRVPVEITTEIEPYAQTEFSPSIYSIITEPSVPVELVTPIKYSITDPKEPESTLEPTKPETDFTLSETFSQTESYKPKVETEGKTNSTKPSEPTTSVITTYPLDKEYNQCFKQLCTEGKICIESARYECVCDEGNGYKDSGSNKCIHIKPCDNRCGHAKCIETGTGINDYKCVCDTGYILEYFEDEDYFCRPAKCQYPLITKCNQLCEDNTIHDNNFKFSPEYVCKCDKGYDLTNDGKTCLRDRTSNCKEKNCGDRGYCAGDKCVCKQTYTMIDGKCEIDQNWCDSNCRGKCIELNNQVVCNCNSPKYKLNKNTGLCDAINLCDNNEVGRKQCDNQRAYCLETDDDKGYRCQCPEGQVLDTDKCRDLCDITLNKVKCESNNGKCVYDKTQDSNFRCDCNPGFYFNESEQTCVMARFTTKTKIQFKNFNQNRPIFPKNLYYELTVHENRSDRNSLNNFNERSFVTGDILRNFTLSLKNFLKVKSLISVSLIYCNKNDNDIATKEDFDYECQITIQMNDEYNQMMKELQNIGNCDDEKYQSSDGKYCYLPPHTLIARKKPIFVNLDPCNDISNACTKFSYSKCESIGTQYQCLCPTNSFRVRETQYLGDGLRFEYCEDIDECAFGKCNEKYKKCINTIGSYECFCDRGYKMNSTGDCVTPCSDVKCEHGVCKESENGGFWCQCDDGYSDELCITKVVDPPQTAFIISSSVLAFVLLSISVIAAFCLGKARGEAKMDYDLPWGDWQAPSFQRTSSNHPEIIPRNNS